MYQVICGLESSFPSMQAAMDFDRARPEFNPRLPPIFADGDDRTTPRISAAPTVKDYITTMKPESTFRRCLDGPCSVDYKNANEAYPILVVWFDPALGWIDTRSAPGTPTALGQEKWLLSKAQPNTIRLCWLGHDSIKIKTDPQTGLSVCTEIKLLQSPTGYSHPWLNGRGHVLDSSEPGDGR